MSQSSSSSAEDSLRTEQSQDIVNLPKYCEFYKFFIVEELALEDNYADLHYGKCTVIGKLRETNSGDFFLENIKLPNLPREYSLPEGSVEIRLLRFNYFGTKLSHGRFVEVCGDVVLLNVTDLKRNRIPLTSRGVHIHMHDIKKEQQHWYLEQLTLSYKPAIKLHFINEVAQPGDLAELNLRIRQFAERKE